MANEEIIEMTRGDSAAFFFQRHDNDGNVIVTLPSEMYFTIKKSYHAKEAIIQKTLADFTLDESAVWHVAIAPQETERIPYGTYYFDVEITDGDAVTTVVKGKFIIEEETTWRENKE